VALGRAAAAPLADTWSFARTGPTEGRWTRQADLVGASYRAFTENVEAPGRANHRMVFDAARGMMVLFGGDAAMRVSYINDSDEGLYSSSSRLLWAGADWRA
jgi:hypothetical protein